jgi:hypothetical protein
VRILLGSDVFQVWDFNRHQAADPLLGQPEDAVQCSWPIACVDLQRSYKVISAAGKQPF